jgi:hypothetical protein
MGNKDFQRDKQQPQVGQQNMGGQRKNNEEVGEPVQLDDDKLRGEQHGKPGAGQGKPGMGQPGMGQKEGEHGGQHQQGGQRQGGAANR